MFEHVRIPICHYSFTVFGHYSLTTSVSIKIYNSFFGYRESQLVIRKVMGVGGGGVGSARSPLLGARPTVLRGLIESRGIQCNQCAL